MSVIEPASTFETRKGSDAPLWHVWAFWLAASALLMLRTVLADEPYDADSLMRLQQVRDLIAGQSWWDQTQYRMAPPDGTSMHWSRIVDMPIAALMLLFGLFMSAEAAGWWASAVVPLLYLGGALFVLRAIMLRLGVPGTFIVIALALSILFPLLPLAFAPMAIDHHGPQAFCALVCVWLYLKAPDRLAAAASGVVAAIWCLISLEGLPVVALIGGAYGLRYTFLRDKSLPYYMTAIAIAAPLLSYATRPPSEWQLWCDVWLPVHSITFATGAALAWLVTIAPGQDKPLARFLSLGAIPLICGPLALSMLAHCPADPFAEMHPEVRAFFHDYVREATGITKQNYDVMAMMLYLPLIVAAGWMSAGKLGWRKAVNQDRWMGYTLILAGVTAYGLWLMRETVMAQLFALPFAAALLAYWLPKARALTSTLPRVFATVAVLLMVGPLGVTLMGKAIAGQVVPAQEGYVPITLPAENLTFCDFTKMRSLPDGHVFATINFAPDVLAHTQHTVEVGGYHREEEALRRSIFAFRSNTAEAREIMRSVGTDYVAVCLLDDSLQLFGKGNPDSLAQHLLRDNPPAWLELHPDFEGSLLRVYTVK